MLSKVAVVAVLCAVAGVVVRGAVTDADAEVDVSAVVAANTATWAHLSQAQLMRLSVFGGAACATVDIAGFDYAKGFAEFCKKYGKVYKAKTYALRFATWKASKNCVEFKNANAHSNSYFQRTNHLHDHTQAEFLRTLGTRHPDHVGTPAVAPTAATAQLRTTTPTLNAPGHGPAAAHKFRQMQAVLAPDATLVELQAAAAAAAKAKADPQSGQSFDWRTRGAVTAVGYQRECGDCWAWSAATVAEGAWAIAGNHLRTLSAQQITDCSPPPSNNGCSGGVPGEALNDMNNAGGFCSDADYPFQGVAGACNKQCKVVAKMSQVMRNYAPSDENQLFDLLKIGPVSVGLVASPSSFMSYGGGVYDDVTCNAAGVNINHGMTIVGYGTDPKNGDYWILKNQWATSWGEQGYMRIKRGVNQCKLVTMWATAKSAAASTFGITDDSAPAPAADPVTPLSPCQTKPDARGVVVRGTCQDVQSCTDNGGAPTAHLCPGAANIQCCLNQASLTPNVAPAPSKVVPCTARHPIKGVMTSGTCIDAGICNAATNLPVRGACAGAANIQCCLPK